MVYHLRRKDRQIQEQEALHEILNKGKFAVISMCRDNEPYVVTLSYGPDLEKNTLYFHCAAEGQKLAFIKANPNVCATVILDHGYIQGSCAHSFSTLIIRGNMKVIEDLEEKKHGMKTLLYHLEDAAETFEQQRLKEDKAYRNICILKLEIRELTGKKGQ